MVKDEHPNTTSLEFVVNGTPTTVENINLNEPLKAAIQRARQQTGNTGRPLSDWLVKYDDKDLDYNMKVKEFDFPSDASIFVSLKAGTGGRR